MKILSALSIYLLVMSLSFAEENAPATADTQPEQPKPTSVVIKPAGEFKYKLIPLKSIDFAMVDKICRPLLSKDGILTFEEKRGSILVGDYPENIEKIMKFLSDIDTDAVNIRIDVDFLNTGSSGSESLDVRVGYGKGIQPNQVIIVDGKGAKAAVRVENIVTKLTVQDGQKIYIGGAVSSNMDFYKNLFGPTLLSSDGKSNVLDMYLKASVMKPGKKAAELPPGTDPHSQENPYKWR